MSEEKLGVKRVENWVGRVHQGDCRKILREIPSESIDTVVYSPPYYGLRDYGVETETVWGGDEDCEHEWSVIETNAPNASGGLGSKQDTVRGSHSVPYDNHVRVSSVCSKCGAWKGQLDLEPDWRMYIEHLVEINRYVKRVLKKTGSLWIIIGDSWAGSMQGYGAKKPSSTGFQFAGDGFYASSKRKPPQLKAKGYPPKCLMGIPYRLAFALIDDGWIWRNSIIWYKINAMPSPVKDRLSQTYEVILHFVKSKKYYYDLNAIRLPPSILTGNERLEKLVRRIYDISKTIRGKTAYRGKINKIGGWKSAMYSEKAYRDAFKILEKQEVLSTSEKKFLQDYVQNHGGHPLGRNPGDVLPIQTRPLKDEHYAAFPIDIPLYPILASCPPDGVVLDPMAGSGTVALTCELINRREWSKFHLFVNNYTRRLNWMLKWILIEINPNYCRIAESRLRPFFTQKRLCDYLDISVR